MMDDACAIGTDIAHLIMQIISGNNSKLPPDTAHLYGDSEMTVPTDNRDVASTSNAFSDAGGENPLLSTILSEMRSFRATVGEKFDALQAQVADMDTRLTTVMKTVDEMKSGQLLDLEANQHWKSQLANEVQKISQHQDIGDSV